MSLKDEIYGHLKYKEFDKLADLAARRPATLKYLVSFLYSEDDLLHWRAVDALGRIAERPDTVTTERLRSVIDRLFNNMNDQSGGNPWGSIEAIGAIIAARPIELYPLIPKMFSFISDSRMWRGLLWSVRRIGLRRPDLFKDKLFHVVGLLRNPRNTTRGHAAWALGTIGDTDVRVIEGLVLDIREALEGLQNDDNRITIYDDAELHEVTVGKLAKDALDAITRDKTGAPTQSAVGNVDFSI